MSVVVRAARAHEAHALASAVAEQPLLKRYELSADRLARELAAAITRGDEVIVAEEDGVAAGFAWFLLSGTFASGAYLRLIALRPGSEGRGVGGFLVDEMERRVSAHTRHLFLLVSHWNEPARRFYARRGYREVGCLPAWARPDTDEIICYKRLR